MNLYFSLVRNLIEEVREFLEERRNREGVDIESKILCTLRFYATGSYQRCVGQDFGIGLAQTTVHRCIQAVTRAIVNLSDNYVQMPNTPEERNNIKLEFMNQWGFPGAIGAIDGFHVAILKPSQDEQNYRNRKGYHSLNVQLICDPQLRIRSIWPNFGGSTHDSYIWRVSRAQNFMLHLNAANENSWLIGDSGYPLQRYLLTPFRETETPAQQNYNICHIAARNCVERCIGVLKQRFRCLLKERSARYSPSFMAKVIKACAILHNMCRNANIPFIEEFEENYGEPENEIIHMEHPQNNGIEVRQNIVNLYF